MWGISRLAPGLWTAPSRGSPPRGIAGGKFRSTTGQNRLKPMETGAGILTF